MNELQFVFFVSYLKRVSLQIQERGFTLMAAAVPIALTVMLIARVLVVLSLAPRCVVTLVLVAILMSRPNSALVVSVPCGGKSTYNANITADTTLLLRGCSNSVGTAIVVWFDQSSPAASSGLTIVVEDSQRVAVQLSGNVNASNLVVMLRNVTNDAEEQRISNSEVCSPTMCLALIRIMLCPNLVNTTISLTNVTHARNTQVVLVDVPGSVAQLNVSITNATVVSTSTAATFNHLKSMRDAHIVIAAVNFTSTSSNHIISLNNISTMTNVSVDVTTFNLRLATANSLALSVLQVASVPTCTHFVAIITNVVIAGGAAAPVNVIYLNRSTCTACTISAANVVTSQLTEANMVTFTSSIATASSISVVGAASASDFQGIWRCVAFQSSTATNATFSCVDSSGCSTSNAVTGILVYGSTLNASAVNIRNVTLKGADVVTAVAAALQVGSFLEKVACLTRLVISISNTTAVGVVTTVAYITSAEIDGGSSLVVDGVVLHSQYFGVFVDHLAPGSGSFTVRIVNTFVVAAFPLLMQALEMSNATVDLRSSTFQTVASSLLTSVISPIRFSSMVLRRSNVALTDVNVVSSTLPHAGPVVYLSDCSILEGTIINLSFAGVAGLGAVSHVFDSFIDGASSVTVEVRDDIAAVPEIAINLFVVQNIKISDRSVLQVRFPANVTTSAAAISFAAIYVFGVSIVGFSSLTIGSGAQGSPSTILWPNRVAYFSNVSATNSSRFLIEDMLFMKNTSDWHDTTYFEHMHASLSSALQLEGCHFGSTFGITAAVALQMVFITLTNASCLKLVDVSCDHASWCTALDSMALSSSSLLNHSSTHLSPLTMAVPTVRSSYLVLSSMYTAGLHNITQGVNISIVSGTFSGVPPLRSFIVVSSPYGSPTASQQVIALISVTRSTAVAPWLSVKRAQPLIIVNNVASPVRITLDELYLYGSMSLVEATERLNAMDGAVTAVDVRCSWWGRHPFTPQESLSPLQYAMRGAVLRSDGSAIGPWTTTSAPTCPQHAVNRQRDSSWTATPSNSNKLSSTDVPSPTLSDKVVSETISFNLTPSLPIPITHTLSVTPNLTLTLTVPLLVTASQSTSLFVTAATVTSSRSVSLPQMSGTATMRRSATPHQTRTSGVTLTSEVSSTRRRIGSNSVKESPTASHPLPSPSQASDNAALQAAPFLSAAGALVGGGALGDAATIAALSMMTCGGRDTWDSNTGPQRLIISVFYDLGPGVSVLGNIGIALLVLAIHHVAASCVASRAACRYPNLTWSAFTFLLPGILFGSVSLFAADKDEILGDTLAGRAALGAVAVLISIVIAAGATVLAFRDLSYDLCEESTDAVLCEPFLPNWFIRATRLWLLPRVAWRPKELVMQFGSFFSSVASLDALWVHPLLQVHGAVFALIAAVPFPRAACPAQFVLAIAWTCVPIGLLLRWRLRLLRRPPNNVLSLLGNVLTIGILAATWISVEGPDALREDAANAIVNLGWALTAVSIVKTILSAISALAEALARKRAYSSRFVLKTKPLATMEDILIPSSPDPATVVGANQSPPLSNESSLARALLELPRLARVAIEQKQLDDEDTMALPIRTRTFSTLLHLDELIDELVHSDVFTSTRNFDSMLPVEQQERLAAYALRLLVLRASATRSDASLSCGT